MINRELNFNKYTGNFDGILNKKEIEYMELINNHAEKEHLRFTNIDNMEVSIWINTVIHNKEHKVYYTVAIKDFEYNNTVEHSLIMDLRSSTGYQTIVEQRIYNYNNQQERKSIDFKDFEKVSLKKLEKVLKLTM